MSVNPVVPKNAPPSEQQFQARLVQGWSRCIATIGKGTFADKSGRTVRALDKVLGGGGVTAKGLLDSLTADPSALDELLADYGFKLTALDAVDGADAHLLAATAGLAATHAEAMADGRVDHVEEQRLAAAARPVVAEWTARIARADRKRA